MIPMAALLCILFMPGLHGQDLGNIHQKKIRFTLDTIHLDTLSIIPGTFSMQEIDSSLFSINYLQSTLLFKKNVEKLPDSIRISYRVFPYLFGKSHQHKTYEQIINHASGAYNPFLFGEEKLSENLFKTEGISKSGSISRGISIGNNQNVVVNSNLNLQLSGKITDDIEVLAAVTDDNIPIQPEGNTQQLQVFDKVYIQLFNKNHKLQAGDFDMKKPNGYFMNFFKRAQGGSYKGILNLSPKSASVKNTFIKTEVAAAIAKGRFTKNQLAIEEGNQGPYRLSGANNESYIVIVSGSERVFLNGVQLNRGQENDYVIDYNTAEITFMPGKLITKDSRIFVEFEYADRNYARTLFFSGTEFTKNRFTSRLNIYSEQDNKNQPIQQNLTDPEKILLANVGDLLSQALIKTFQAVAFNKDQIQYQKKDTLIAGQKDTIFVYSRDSSVALFNVNFSRVGTGNGSYVMSKTSFANGRVYEWVGKNKGDFEPVFLLTSPKQQQMFVFGSSYKISKSSTIAIEGATTKNDINLFSSRNKDNDQGYGLKTTYTFDRFLNLADTIRSWKIKTALDYEYSSIYFNPIERYRNVEFNRDWNTVNISKKANEFIPSASISLSQSQTGNISYLFKSYERQNTYKGNMHGLQSNLQWKDFQLKTLGSFLQSKDSLTTANYLKQQADLSYHSKYLIVGAKEETENNAMKNNLNDLLSSSSFSFQEFHLYLLNADSNINQYNLDISRRNDLLPRLSALNMASQADNVQFGLALKKNSNSRFSMNTAYRNLSVLDTTLLPKPSASTFLNRADYYFSIWKGALNASTFYEIGTGQEFKKEYIFVETPAGQGTYIWNDYNKNGIKELNEFEFAVFQNQANYIKVFIPTSENVRSYSNIFNEILNINPASYFQGAKGIKAFISRFSTQTLLRMERKTLNKNIENILNPFAKMDSSAIVENSSFRNTVYFNRSDPHWGIDINYLESKNKQLLINGIEKKQLNEKGANLRWNVSRSIGLKTSFTLGKKSNHAELYQTKNYTIQYRELEPGISFQPSSSFRGSLSYKYTIKDNIESDIENAIIQKISGEMKYNSISKGSFLCRINLINIQSNAYNNSPVSFEMLEGLQVGKNITWNVSIQRNLSENMQMNLSYDGRKPEGLDIIHTGNVQVRAFF